MERKPIMECITEAFMLVRMHTAPPSLKQVQEAVGGYVELVTLDNEDQLLVNEEGLLLGLPSNPWASALSGRRIVGRAVLLQGAARWTE